MDINSILIHEEADGTISFGNYLLKEKAKQPDFAHKGDIYKVKTYNEITKLEKNGLFVYESVPGTTVSHFDITDAQVSFKVTGNEAAQITLELEPEQNYDVLIDGKDAGVMKTNLGGKLSISVEFEADKEINVEIKQRG